MGYIFILHPPSLNKDNYNVLIKLISDPTIINDIEDTTQTVSIANEVDPLVEA